MTILLTGFNPFGGLETNPSQLIVEAIANRSRLQGRLDLVSAILETEYVASEIQLRKLILEINPETCLGLGVDEGSNSLALERFALNLDDNDAPDNSGELRQEKPIVIDGPDTYRSTLPLSRILDALKVRDIPVRISNHAGTYVCNHVFYTARHEIEKLKLETSCGFIHVPMISDADGTQMRTSPGLSLDTMVRAIECCLDVIRQESISKVDNS